MTDREKKECLNFEQVLTEELKEIECLRQVRTERSAEPDEQQEDRPGNGSTVDPQQKAYAMKLAGLAFSGGGIRSATFNLGVMQGLARAGLLRKFDYLSTVSGGGYIGSWIAAWIKRERSLDTVEEELRRQRGSGAEYREPEAISYLRQYSNYLTPRMGMLTADTWALISTYLRNLTLNLLTITSVFMVLFLIPWLTVLFSQTMLNRAADHQEAIFICAMVFLAVGVYFISANQVYWSVKKQRTAGTLQYPWYARQGGIILSVVLPIMLSALIGGVWLWNDAQHHERLQAGVMIAGAAIYFVSWLLGSIGASFQLNAALAAGPSTLRRVSSAAGDTLRMIGDQWARVRAVPRHKVGIFLFCIALSMVCGALFFHGFHRLMRTWNDAESARWLVVNFAVPLIVIIYMAIATLQIGFMGRQLPDDSREWWSRLGGWLSISAGLWTVVCAIAFFSLPLIAKATALISFGWVISTITGVILGRSPATGGKGSKKWLEVLVKVVPYIFILGLLMFLAFLTSTVLILTNPNWDPALWKMIWLDTNSLKDLVATNYFIMNYSLTVRLAWMFLVSLGAALVLSWRIDINQFSIHNLYRNRLTRGYLGASNRDRNSQAFTGFDPDDDVPLGDLRSDRAAPAKGYHGPYPIINTALNLVGGRNLAWQTRKATSFFFAPLYSGYGSRSPKDADAPECCYRPTDHYAEPDGMSLGTAMAISGAAASPNMGYHSSPSLAFLMTVFNVRLGWWSGNPRYRKAWHKAGPTIGLWYMLKELFGFTDDRSRFVYLSDGGHFENLGIYELVKRRCRFIIACDAGQDRDMKFDDLGNALRKIRVDLGVDITIDVGPIRDRKKHCALGRIIYHLEDGRQDCGDLIYIKASLCGKEPADVLNYKSLHGEFPHQTTADQWFDEAQFESYRMLGLHTVLEMCERWDGQDMETLVKRVEQYIEQA
jgi:hypothetical protein